MTNEPSPRPWRVHEIEHQVLQQQVRGLCHAIFDSRDRIVAIPTSCREDADFIVDAANAALIVDAVNARDRLRDELARKVQNYEDVIAYHRRTEESLRDIVRRMADTLEHVSNEHRFDFYELVSEARAAIGEDKE